jgi:1-acyl-sn-glycerol-3-phosphate acyltransferase
MSEGRSHPVAALLAFVARLVSGASVRFIGGPPGEGQRIYFANHSSHLDAIVLWASLPSRIRPRVRPVAARDYWDRGAIRRYLASRAFRAYLVERGGPGDEHERRERALRGMVEALGTRDSLILFPEGTRGTDNEPAPFRSGLYHLALARPDVDLVPVYMENLNRILPKGELLPVPFVSRVTFGRPMRCLPGEAKAEFLDRARLAVVELRTAQS